MRRRFGALAVQPRTSLAPIGGPTGRLPGSRASLSRLAWARHLLLSGLAGLHLLPILNLLSTIAILAVWTVMQVGFLLLLDVQLSILHVVRWDLLNDDVLDARPLDGGSEQVHDLLEAVVRQSDVALDHHQDLHNLPRVSDELPHVTC